MRRALVFAVAGLLVLAGTAPGLTASGPPASLSGDGSPSGVQTPPPEAATQVLVNRTNATNALQIPSEELEATRIDVVTLSAGGAVAIDSGELHGRFDANAFEARLAAAETDAERRAVVSDAVARIESRLTRLQADARTARQQFNDGGPARAYLYEVARLYATANELDRFSAQVARAAERVPDTSVNNRLSEYRSQLDRFGGPVRAAISDALTGEESPARVYIATSAEGVVLATTVDGVYLRDAYRGAYRRMAGPREVTSVVEASNRIHDTYPWAWENQLGLTASTAQPAGVFSFELETPQGTLVASLDARSGRVYREIQRAPLSSQYLTGQRTESEGLRLAVNRSYGGGPLQVRLTDARTGVPVNGTVIINGDRVGVTGTDGTLWTLAPYQTEDTSVVVVRDGEEISISAGGGPIANRQ